MSLKAGRTNAAKAIDGNTQLLLCHKGLLVAAALGLQQTPEPQQMLKGSLLGPQIWTTAAC